jgi:hypothetical protein
VLLCGTEKVLCETRQALLESEGYVASVALDPQQFARLRNTHPHWDLFIICHTLIKPEPVVFERLVALEADTTGAAVYRVRRMVTPPEFLRVVQRILRGDLAPI